MNRIVFVGGALWIDDQRFRPGLVKQECFRLNVQADDEALKVPLNQLTDAAGPPSIATKRKEFPAGLIPIAAVGYLKTSSGNVSWMPPGAKEFVPIPGNLFFHREK